MTPKALAPLLAEVAGLDAVATAPELTPVAPDAPLAAAGAVSPEPAAARGAEPPGVAVLALAEAEPLTPVPVLPDACPVPTDAPAPEVPPPVEPGLAWLGMARAATRIPPKNAAMTVAGVRALRRVRRTQASTPLVELGPDPDIASPVPPHHGA